MEGSGPTMERDYGGEWPDYGEGLWRGVTRLWRGTMEGSDPTMERDYGGE